MGKTVQELNLMDDFLMQEVVMDEEYGLEFCQILLRTILNRNVKVVQVKVQNQITTGQVGRRAIRLDVYLEEEPIEEDIDLGSIYDVEVQKEDTKELPQRTRYYQALIDSKMLKAGVPYKKLKDLWIIMITPVDLFGRDRMCYTFENRCVEEPDLALNDGARKIFLYSKGKVGSREDLKELLEYMENSTEENVVDATTQKLHEIVANVKQKEEVGVRYMKAIEYEEMIRERAEREGREKGEREGKAEGIKEGVKEGIKEGIKVLLETLKEFNVTKEEAIEKVKNKFSLSEEEAEEYIAKYWK